MNNESHNAHEQFWELLPWLVNGSLPVDQIEAVERHTAECETCAAEVKALHKLKGQMRSSGALLLAPQTSWQKMNNRLDREEEILSGQAMQSHRPRLSGNSSWSTGRWQALAAAQTLVIMGLVASVVWSSRSGRGESLADNTSEAAMQLPAQYGTLTTDTSAASSVATLRVVFRHDAPIGDVSALLHGASVQMLGGPSEAGVYTLRPNAPLQLPQLLDRLRSDPRVVFVEPQDFTSPTEK